MDVEGQVRPGDDFVRVMTAKVSATEVMLMIIGPRWIELLKRRANQPMTWSRSRSRLRSKWTSV
jgi:hypothetical protein